jgi:hypothetical protein
VRDEFSRVRRLTLGAWAPNPHTPVIKWTLGHHDRFTCSRANIRVSVIDPPRTERIDDPRASRPTPVHWHFGPDTGSRYWLNRAKTLDFNSMTEAMADELQHRGQDPSEIGNWTWDPPQ